MDQNESFSYTYSAKEQKELENIRRKYLPKEEDKMDQLRKLDAVPHQKAQVKSLCVGILGTLIMGTGMSMAMTDIGAALGSFAMMLGIVVGLVGMVLVALAYPVYSRIFAREQQRIAPEILRLTEELMQ